VVFVSRNGRFYGLGFSVRQHPSKAARKMVFFIKIISANSLLAAL